MAMALGKLDPIDGELHVCDQMLEGFKDQRYPNYPRCLVSKAIAGRNAYARLRYKALGNDSIWYK